MGVPKYDDWLSIAYEFRNKTGSNVMVFENWRNVVELWQAIEKYWKIRNLVVWHTINRQYGYSGKRFFEKYDIIPLASKGKTDLNLESENELDEEYENIVYAALDKYHYDKHLKGSKYFVSDHITHPVGSTKSSGGQNIIAGTKPIQILVPYIKILSPRNGIVMEPFGGSGSTIIASEIMKRKCRTIEITPLYAEVIIRRWEKFSGRVAKRLS